MDTTVQLPVSASSKGTASLHVKVDAGAGGNVLSLCAFKHLYPNWISPAGLPTRPGSCQHQAHCIQMDPIYHYIPHSHIPHHLVARHPWCLTSQDKLLLVCCRHPRSCHPRSSIMCKRLAVVKMNCAVTVIKPKYKTSKPCTCSHSNNNGQAYCSLLQQPSPSNPLMTSLRSFPDQFTGIGRFPGEYTIWLWLWCPSHHTCTPRKFPITLHPKVKEHLNKMECMGVITHVDQPTWTGYHQSPTFWRQMVSYDLCLDPHDLNKAIHHDHRKMPTVEKVAYEFALSHCFTKLDAHHGYWSICSWSEIQPTHNLQQPLSEDTISCIFPLALSVLMTSSRRRWTRYWKSAKDA